MQRDLVNLRGHIFNKYHADFTLYYNIVDIHIQNMQDKIYSTLEKESNQNVADHYVAQLAQLTTSIHKGYYYLENDVYPEIERMNLSELIQIMNYTLQILLQIHEKTSHIIDQLEPYNVNFGDFMDLYDQLGMGIDEVREDLGINNAYRH